MSNRVGIGKRLDHASPSRFKGHSQTVLVKITTDQGIIGWGEAHAPAAPAVHAKVVTDLLAPILVGQDARNIGPLWEKMYSSQRLRGYATGFFTESIAGVDIALWDILGQFVGVPLYQLLGGKYRDRIPTYSGAGTAESAHKAMEEGFTAVKMGFSKGVGSEDFERVVQVSEAVGTKGQLLIDSLGAFKLHEAISAGRKLDELGNIGWFEDALMPEDTASYAQLAEALDHVGVVEPPEEYVGVEQQGHGRSPLNAAVISSGSWSKSAANLTLPRHCPPWRGLRFCSY
jgi:L-alanine-DL-glutamate epimerase-like enolase superfamily enzyme